MRKSSTKKIGWGEIRSVLLCILSFLLAFSLITASVFIIKDATMSMRERTKLRLMYMIEHQGWNPFTSTMSLEEYFALMELYDDGKLPLKNSTVTYADGEDNGDTDTSGMGGPANRLYFPREKFLLSGLDLTNYNGTTPQPLLYNRENRYGPHDPNTYAKEDEYTTNTFVRYEALSATFVEINEDGTTLSDQEYEVIDGLLCNKDTKEEYKVAEGEKPIFKITELPNNDRDKINWEYELDNGVLYLIDDDGSRVDGERPHIRIYTPRYYEMDGVTYVFQENELHVGADDFDRVYNNKYKDEIKAYQFALKDEQGNIYVMNKDVDGSAGFHVYKVVDGSLTGDKITLSGLDGKILESLSTTNATGYNSKYIVLDGVIYEYDDNSADKTNNRKVFNEDEVDYYLVDGRLCEWRRGKLYDVKSGEEYSIKDGPAADQIIKELAYYYPANPDIANGDYMRPSHSWLGLMISSDTAEDPVPRVSIVQEKENTGRIAGYVRQDLFGKPIYDANNSISGFEEGVGIQYGRYYIKRITLDAANVNVLGIIWAEDLGRYVYYYLSAEGQSTQVSTTTLNDDQKFIIEYVPFEYEVKYKVENTAGVDITWSNPGDAVMFGSSTPTEVGWLDSIFGANRPTRTVDGAYSFDVLVPYGYEVRIIIKVTRNIEGGPYKVGDKVFNNIPYSFTAGIDHTSSRKTVMNTWLASYGQYLVENGIITDVDTIIDRKDLSVVIDDVINENNLQQFINKYVKIIENDDGYSFEWNVAGDVNKKIHDGVFTIIAERVNDIRMHNSALNKPDTGFPLGMSPDYSVDNGSQQLPSESGPAAYTFTDTFYNHFVKADREVVAVLNKLKDPVFDASRVLPTDNAKGRGSVATQEWADADEATLIKYYEMAVQNITNGLPLKSGSAPHNVDTSDSWSWNNSSLFSTPAAMKANGDGSFNYDFFFQTNNGDSFYLDVLEINGVAIQTPFGPRYAFSNYEGKKADEIHPWKTTGTLPDGAKVTVEFWYGWHSSRDQHHYCIRIEGARTNVTISGFNLMQYVSGAKEFSVYNLVGVYSDLNGETQQQEAIEYFGTTEQNKEDVAWVRATESTMYVTKLSADGDSTNGYANIRFKIADGYGTPYFIWDTLRSGIAYASVPIDDNGFPDTTKPNNVINFSEIKEGVDNITFDSKYIYHDDRKDIGGKSNPDYGYYYIRIDGSGGESTLYGGDKMALLTIVARTVKYTVRYVPYVVEANGPATLSDGYSWAEKPDVTLYNYPVSGYVLDRETNELKPMTSELLAKLGGEKEKFSLLGSSMPLTKHEWEECALADTLRDANGNLPTVGSDYYKYLQILHEYDDYGGNYYDLLYNTVATVASNDNGIIRPIDSSGQFAFVSWVVVGADYKPWLDEHENPIYFSSGAIDLKEYSNYTVKHSAFGTSDMDINVLRLMPVWRANRETTTYRVVLNWVDALGVLHAEDYSALWDDIVTERPDNGTLYVFLNQDATALHNWISLHPTYTFWNAVNNATTDRAIEKALKDYVGDLFENPDTDKDFINILNALTQKSFFAWETVKDENGKEELQYKEQKPHTGFRRLGADIFALDVSDLDSEEGVTISIWMYENKGGFVFHKEVAEEPFVANDEFYFTVINAHSGRKITNTDSTGKVTVRYEDVLEGTYKAYPQFVYNDNGTVRDPKDSDAWIVTFDKDGNISEIRKDNTTLTEIIKDENGQDVTVNVTYFTLKDGEGIRLYVPEGQYTVVELGSKSGGSYQAHVEYAASDGSPAPGNWEIQEDEVWLKGDTRVTESGSSQVSVTVDFEIGEHNVVQILTFYNQTTSLSLEKTIDAADKVNNADILNTYQKLTFTLKVTLQLPADNTGSSAQDVDTRTPIVGYDEYYDEDKTQPVVNSKYYYFTANYYTGVFEVDNEASTEGHTVEHEIVERIEIRFVNTDEGKNQWTAYVPIKAGERIVIIMTADYDNINYWVEELDNQLIAASEGVAEHWLIEGYVYAVLTEVQDPLNNSSTFIYKYTYYKDLEEAKKQFTDSTSKVYNELVNDAADDFTDKEYIQPATLAKMGLTPLISPSEGSAQKGKKDIVSVINWYGDLPGYGYLRLTATTIDGNTDAVLIFKITSAQGMTLYVTLQAGQTAYVYLQSGIYTVEVTGWSWRYENEGGTVTDPTKDSEEGGSNQNTSERLTVTISQANDSRKNAVQADYTFSPNYKGWLGGENGIAKGYESVSGEGSGDTSRAD